MDEIIKVGSKVKINIETLEKKNWMYLDGMLKDIVIENKDTVFTVDEIRGGGNEPFPYTLDGMEICFNEDELILVSE